VFGKDMFILVPELIDSDSSIAIGIRVTAYFGLDRLENVDMS